MVERAKCRHSCRHVSFLPLSTWFFADHGFYSSTFRFDLFGWPFKFKKDQEDFVRLLVALEHFFVNGEAGYPRPRPDAIRWNP